MKAILDIILSIVFTIALGAFGSNAYQELKKESLTKVHKGLSPLTSFTVKLTSK